MHATDGKLEAGADGAGHGSFLAGRLAGLAARLATTLTTALTTTLRTCGSARLQITSKKGRGGERLREAFEECCAGLGEGNGD